VAAGTTTMMPSWWRCSGGCAVGMLSVWVTAVVNVVRRGGAALACVVMATMCWLDAAVEFAVQYVWDQQDKWPFVGTDNCDPSISMASDYAAYHDMTLQFKSDLNNPVALFRQRNKGYLVRLAISVDVEGPYRTDYHFVAYLADLGFVVDSYPGRPVLAIDDFDRSSNDKAIQVFYDLFPGAQKIQMTHVYCLEQIDRKPRST